MYGKILGIDGNNIKVENLTHKIEIGFIEYHVVFESNNSKFVGFINNVFEEYFSITLIGEIKRNRFVSGVFKKPSLESKVRNISREEIELILGKQDYMDRDTLLIGNSVIYNGMKVTVSKSNFFSSHFAILGNTGSGKSCGLARMMQNVFYNNRNGIPQNAHFLIFDAYREHVNAMKNLSKINGLNYMEYSCDKYYEGVETLKIPPYFLDVDDLALLLDVNSPDLIHVVESTLRLTFIFTSSDENLRKFKNSIIANSLNDILASGKPATQIRDQIVAVLTKYSTEDINLNTIIHQPGYDRTLKQCLLVDNQGKMNAINLIVDLLADYINTNVEDIEIKPGFHFTLNDFYEALQFSLINEGILNSNDTYSKLNSLMVRLKSILNSDIKKIFEFDGDITKEEYVTKFFMTKEGSKAQVVDVSFGELDERTSKVLTKILSKIFFSYASSLRNRGSFPVHIIIEEAHRYVQNDSDVAVLGYNIFERITKEGRKYGVILGLITQRPMELSKTVLSQCANFIVFRMYHPDDLDIITGISTNIDAGLKEKIKVLHPGMALCFGNSFPSQVLVEFDLPDPMPVSTNVNVTKLWY